MIYDRFNPLKETGKNQFLKMFGLKNVYGCRIGVILVSTLI